ncbi:MAG: ATP-dependent nuclease, subunit, partial [Myxococcaceae bacterium]|nr:ATP-dependent nuclease, subunit [Myxococcaceae bacterium]
MKPLVDQDARDKIRGGANGEWLDKTLIVEAAAGTGKTTELVQRVMALLGSGKSTLARLVAVTFTEKAAGEMKLRLRSEIEKSRTDPATAPEARAHFEHALEELEAAHIGTIHGFCSDLLRERPVEAKVDPLFEVAAEEEKERLLEDSFEPWFQAELGKPREGVRRLLRRRSRERDSTGPRYALRNAGAALIEQR